jgi:hypothetical protein
MPHLGEKCYEKWLRESSRPLASGVYRLFAWYLIKGFFYLNGNAAAHKKDLMGMGCDHLIASTCKVSKTTGNGIIRDESQTNFAAHHHHPALVG